MAKTGPDNRRSLKPRRELCRVTLCRDHHRWTFSFTDGDDASVIKRIAELAKDPHVPLDWFDASVLCRHIACVQANPGSTRTVEDIPTP